MTNTQPIFTPDCLYLVKQSFTSGPMSVFDAGEILVFQRNTYSFYDNSFVYVFRGQSTGEIKEWWLLEGQSKELWQEYFEALSGEL